MLKLTTAGESHGPALVAILEGLPQGLEVAREAIDRALERRQRGVGRSGRMKIEEDRVEVLAGLRGGRTIGSPLALLVRNRDFWRDSMDPFAPPTEAVAITRPRPGHVDFAGAIKFGLRDAREIAERASARGTAVQVAAGAVVQLMLARCGIELLGHVVQIGNVRAPPLHGDGAEIRARVLASEVGCADRATSAEMVPAIETAQAQGDSLGGVVEVVAWGMVPGLGSHATPTGRLDARLAEALMAIPAVKGIEVGLGFAATAARGSEVHDALVRQGDRFARPTNRAGGIEGGLSNGEPLVVRAAMKPLPTLGRPLPSVDLVSGEAVLAHKERTDCCAVPAAAVVAEAAVALVLADALLERTGGATMAELEARVLPLRESLAF